MAAPATLASVEELAEWLGEEFPTGSVEAKRAAMCLRAASALVRRESGRTWLDGSAVVDPLPDEVRMVTIYCAARVFENANAQTSGAIDDAQQSWRVDEAGAYLTVSEKRQLSGLRESSHTGIGTVATTRREPRDPAVGWVPTDTPDVYFPWY